MRDDLLVSEFVEAIRERAESEYKGRLQQAFVAWYVEAEFGRVEWDFTDDAGDGGIDAIVWRPGDRPAVVILQSKFSERVGGGLLAPAAYREFGSVIDAFYQPDDVFEKFLASVREDARRTYRRAQERLDEASNWHTQKLAFRLITTCRRRPRSEHERLPESAYCYDEQVLDLYRQYRKGHTPKARDLCLHVEDKLPYRDAKRGVTSYLFNARVSDFRRYFESSDVARLVARNIRFNLAGRIGKAIRTTYEREPHNFWYVHNGITIVCDDYTEKDQTAILTNPSVVNGAQTLYAIAASPRKSSGALVATRVVVRERHHTVAQEDDEWVQMVIRGVNTQNRVRNQDFRSNEPEQLEVQHLFRDQKVFYERKRGEWREYRNDPKFRSFSRTGLRQIGMILTAISDADGAGVVLVKRGVEAIFEPKNYRRLFPSRSRIGRRFERIYLAYRTANFVRHCAYRSAAEFRKQRHAFWTTVWLFHKGLTADSRFFSKATVRSIGEGFDRLQGPTMAGMRARKSLKQLRASVWAAWRKARRVDIERWTASNFFKSKWGHRKVALLAFPKHRKRLEQIGSELFA
jgi:hypothetical protein